MPALLYGIGAFTLFAGLLMIGFGIPINEFSFGNTLIGAGTTASVGGLIIIGLGVVAGQLRRVAETMAMPLPGRPAPAPEASRSSAAATRVQRPAGLHSRPGQHRLRSIQCLRPAANPYEEKFEEVSAPSAAQSGHFGGLRRKFRCRPRVQQAPVKPPANDLSAFGRPQPVRLPCGCKRG